MALDIEIVIYPRFVPRAKAVLLACNQGLERLGRKPVIREAPEIGRKIFVTWGLGHPQGQQLIREAKAQGGHVIGFDAGYFSRKTAYRVTVDHDHPQAIVMKRQLPEDRWNDLRISLGHDYNPKGHILLIGTGYKTAQTYNEKTGDWETRKAAALLKKYPGRKLIFRPKPGGRNEIIPRGFIGDRLPRIEQSLTGCCLAVCRNSNAAVDAIIAGVPFDCEDGAAMAVQHLQPLNKETRLNFLRNLAWFNYNEAELRQPETWKTILQFME